MDFKFSDWRDADYYDLSTQPNVHSLAHIRTEKNTSKFLVSCINCRFHSIEYHPKPSESGVAQNESQPHATAPLMKTMQFSNLPVAGDAEIVAISVFERLPPAKGLVVGISYVITRRIEEEQGERFIRRRSPLREEFRSEEKGPEYYCEDKGKLHPPKASYDKQRSQEQQEALPVNQALNIYSVPFAQEEGAGETSDILFNLETIAENCQTVSLPYIPYCLINTVVEVNGVSTPVFVISGSDFQVHLYKEDTGAQPGIVELVSGNLFPELKNLNDIVTVIEFTQPDPEHRMTAFAYHNGRLAVHQVNVKTLDVVNVWETSVDGPISSLRFFTHRKKAPVPPSFQSYVDETGQGGLREETENPDFTQIHLLVTSHLQTSAVYWNVLNSGVSEMLTLPDSDKFDVVNCGLALDVDFDGENEVIVGTYGQELLVYKFFPTLERQVPVSQSEREASTSPPSYGSSRRLTVSTLSPTTEDSSKHRHKSEEGNTAGKNQDQRRKVKSQENLMSMIAAQEKGQDPGPDGGSGAGAGAEMRTILEPHYRLQGRKPFPCPIMALGGGDMMGDGVENLVVLTCFGIHVLQPDVNKLMDLITERLKQMDLTLNAEDARDDFHKLQIE
ncbi:hypothetical protein ACOMHN_013139 [Nucella lapillus]